MFISEPESTLVQPPQRYNYPFYNYVNEREMKFPQYGQVNGRHNPWSEIESNRRLPPALPPSYGYSSNPWDLTGNRIIGLEQYSGPRSNQLSRGYSANTPGNFSLQGFGNEDGMFPDYTDGIFRDTNPASMGPFFNGLMPGSGFLPGLENDKFDFPFSPFSMF